MFKKFKVRTRIFIGFAATIVVSLSLAGFGVFQLSEVGRQVGRMVALTGNVDRVLSTTAQLEAIRRAETELRLGANETVLHEVQENSRSAQETLAEAARATLSAERRTLYESVRSALASHDEATNQFWALATVWKAEKTRLFAAGDALTSATGKLVAAAGADTARQDYTEAARLNAATLLVRVANWRFIATNDPKGPANFAQKLADAGPVLGFFDKVPNAEERRLAATVRAALDVYADAFGKYATAITAANALYTDTLQPQLRDMQAKLANASASLHDGFVADSRRTQTILSETASMQEIVAAFGLAIGIGLAILIGRGVVLPISAMTAAMTRLAGGDRDVDVPARDQADEIGEMARAVEVFRQQAIQNAQLSAEAARDRAAKDRRQKSMDAHTQDFGTSIAGVMERLTSAATAMQHAAMQVSGDVQRTRISTSGCVEGAAISARDLNCVAAAAEEMAASINEISQQVNRVTHTVQSAVEHATTTNRKVASLSEAADRIGDVVRLITHIASQTNLLALNATIESARAGDAGKGFAVVAGEVKALATQTAQATTQIGNQILAIREATGEAVAAVREVGVAIHSVEEVATAIAAAVEQQAVATREITMSVQQVTNSTAAASQAMNDVLAIADTTEANSRSALAVAEEVNLTSSTLKQEVVDFLAAMSGGEETERRLYERIDAHGVEGVLRIGAAPGRPVTLADISRGGVALLHECEAAPGADVEIDLPGSGTVKGRIARKSGGVIGVSFRQDQASLQRIDRAIQAISASQRSKAA